MKPRKTSPWAGVTRAAKDIGISSSHLKMLRNDGTLKQGKHYRNIASSRSLVPRYQYHVTNIETLLATPRSER